MLAPTSADKRTMTAKARTTLGLSHADQNKIILKCGRGVFLQFNRKAFGQSTFEGVALGPSCQQKKVPRQSTPHSPKFTWIVISHLPHPFPPPALHSYQFNFIYEQETKHLINEHTLNCLIQKKKSIKSRQSTTITPSTIIYVYNRILLRQQYTRRCH